MFTPALTQSKLFENTCHIKSNVLIITRKYYIEYIYTSKIHFKK